MCSGSSSRGPHKDYSLSSNDENLVFGIFNAMAIVATPYGNGIIPEIQVNQFFLKKHFSYSTLD